MSWYRKVIIINTINIITLMFIIWSFITVFAFGYNNSDANFIILIVLILVMQYGYGRSNRKRLISIITAIAGTAIFYFIGYQEFWILNSLILIVSIIIFYKRHNEAIDPGIYSIRIRNSFIFLAVLELILFNKDKAAFADASFRYTIVYIISSLLLLREARLYFYRVKGPMSRYINYSIIVLISIITIKPIYNFIGRVFKLIFTLVFTIYKLIAQVALYVLYPIFKIISNIAIYFINKAKRNGKVTDEINNTVTNEEQQKIITTAATSPIVIRIIEIALVLVALLILYKIFAKGISKTREDDRVILQEIVEDIEKDKKTSGKKNKKKAVKRGFQSLSAKEKILSLFKEFQKSCFEKGIFKNYMTSTNLKNILRPRIEKKAELEFITEKYNEVKFSNHNLEETEVEKFKANIVEINKEIKNI